MSAKANLRKLWSLVGATDGNVPAAVRLYSGKSTSTLAAELGLDRASVQLCLAQTYGRRYESIRRALELGLNLPPYGLDTILDKGE